MLDLAYDLQQVFYGEDFALNLLRVLPGTSDVMFRGIIGIVDVEALEGRSMTATRTLQCAATVDLRVDDLLQALEPSIPQRITAGDKFKVLDVPQRINDGAEVEMLLGSVKA